MHSINLLKVKFTNGYFVKLLYTTPKYLSIKLTQNDIAWNDFLDGVVKQTFTFNFYFTLEKNHDFTKTFIFYFYQLNLLCKVNTRGKTPLMLFPVPIDFIDN